MIDDVQEILNVVELILTEDGHEIIPSTDSSILERVDDLVPHLILPDNWLPGEYGSD